MNNPNPRDEVEQAFESWWAERVAEGYQYGRGPLATVRFGFEAGFAAARATAPTPVSTTEPNNAKARFCGDEDCAGGHAASSLTVPAERICKCGMSENDPIHSFTTLFQKAHQFTARGKAEVRTAPIGPIAGGASHEPTCGVWRGSSCDCVTRINNLAQEAAEVPAAWAKFRNSVGFQFGFVLYSELPAETAVDHVCKAAETLFAALSATTAPTPVEDERARGIAASKRDREQRLEQLATCKNGHDTRHYYGWLADIDYLLTRLSQAEARMRETQRALNTLTTSELLAQESVRRETWGEARKRVQGTWNQRWHSQLTTPPEVELVKIIIADLEAAAAEGSK